MGKVIWLFGLSGAGKTTLARNLEEKLRPSSICVLDGDTMRSKKPRGFTREERTLHLREMATLASQKAGLHDYVLCSFITPYESVRNEIRKNHPDFLWMWVDCPLAVCEKRDIKGLYLKARTGEIPHFTGITDPFETPTHFDLRLETDKESVSQSIERILNHL